MSFNNFPNPIPSTLSYFQEGSAIFWQIVTAAGALIMRVIWSSAVFVLIAGISIDASRSRSLFVFTLVALAIYLTGLVLSYFKIRENTKWIVMIFVFMVGFLVSLRFLLYPEASGRLVELINLYLSGFTDISFWLRPEFLTTLLLFILWRKGLSSSRQWVGPVLVSREMRIGMIVLLLVGYVGSRTNGYLPGVESAFFLFISLLTMGSARITSLSYLRGGRGIPFEVNWAFGIILLAGLVLGSALVLGYFGAGPVAVVLDGILSAAYGIFIRAVLILISPVVYIITRVAVWFFGRFDFILNPEIDVEIIRLGEELQMELDKQAEDLVPVGPSGELTAILRVVAISLGVAILIYLLIRTARQMNLQRQTLALEDQDREPLSTLLPDAIAAVFRNSYDELLERLRRMSPTSRILAAAKIRRIYFSLMQLSERLGSPRPNASTPIEFLSSLDRQFPGSQEDLALITQAYVRVRYGELPEDQKEVEAVEEAWSRVEAYGKELARRLY